MKFPNALLKKHFFVVLTIRRFVVGELRTFGTFGMGVETTKKLVSPNSSQRNVGEVVSD